MEFQKTKREYRIKRHYTCQTHFFVYTWHPPVSAKPSILVRPPRPVQKRHYGHRSKVKRAADGIGEHFHKHAVDLGLSLNTQMDQIMQHCNITIIANVEPDLPWSKSRLDSLEAELEDRVMTLEKHGGMNRKEERA